VFLSQVKLPNIPTYEVHQHLHTLFDDGPRKFLYRRMDDGYLMLSITRPHHPCTELPLSSIPTGRPVSFAADLVITKREKAHGYKRREIHDRFRRRDWLKRQLGDAATLRFVRFEDEIIRIKNGVTARVAQTTGVIEVHDRGRFASLLQFGIGKNRAFGCGLIYLPEIMPWPPR